MLVGTFALTIDFELTVGDLMRNGVNPLPLGTREDVNDVDN